MIDRVPCFCALLLDLRILTSAAGRDNRLIRSVFHSIRRAQILRKCARHCARGNAWMSSRCLFDHCRQVPGCVSHVAWCMSHGVGYAVRRRYFLLHVRGLHRCKSCKSHGAQALSLMNFRQYLKVLCTVTRRRSRLDNDDNSNNAALGRSQGPPGAL